jgi:F0F1-type ATP synthase assembly protein I
MNDPTVRAANFYFKATLVGLVIGCLIDIAMHTDGPEFPLAVLVLCLFAYHHIEVYKP